ncbi:MAG: DUF302 domain-containing protein [Verrucomicrobia bacterium]|nr:DUF302 domain-containing protein [Verrucomicrobiota bacterium]MBV8485872.1 DUF302 domain-containing protein [Verrucomicrobiota bacterium]
MTSHVSHRVMDFISSHPAQETADLLESFLSGKGMKIFARIDQAAEAAAVGLELRPTILLLFGNPKAGTPLMVQYPGLALDLPLKALVWEEAGQVHVTFTGPEELKERYNLPFAPFEAVPGLLKSALG